ncbi:MAG TPA: hypothetical protein GXX18_14740 [Bacillales bacterium]|nr:hypothetical protein [Bacillales bacterium]
MKKIVTLLMGLFVLTGCNSGENYNVEVAEAPVYKPDHTPAAVSFKISEGENAAEGLEVTATFEMEKMDHGSIQTKLKDQGEGLYGSEVALPMGGDWQALLTIHNGKTSTEKLVKFTVEEPVATVTTLPEGVVATVNGEEISEEDIKFYEAINTIQIEMYREADKVKYQGKELEEAMKYWDAQTAAAKNKNTLLTQVIRLRAMTLLAEEKGHKASSDEIQAKLNETKNSYRNSEVAEKLIKEYGAEKFWATQEKQQKSIVLVSKVQQDVVNNVKEANPKAESKEINMLAEKKYEELLVSQVGTLDIKLNKS